LVGGSGSHPVVAGRIVVGGLVLGDQLSADWVGEPVEVDQPEWGWGVGGFCAGAGRTGCVWCFD
jgi:hypothetical protein